MKTQSGSAEDIQDFTLLFGAEVNLRNSVLTIRCACGLLVSVHICLESFHIGVLKVVFCQSNVLKEKDKSFHLVLERFD